MRACKTAQQYAQTIANSTSAGPPCTSYGVERTASSERPDLMVRANGLHHDSHKAAHEQRQAHEQQQQRVISR